MKPIPLFAIALLAAVPAFARTSARPPQTAAGGPVAPRSGFRAEYLRDLADVQQKTIELATAIPADKYNWRPGAGVRSISEVYMHMAGGNYFLVAFVGGPAAYDTNNFEKITDKTKVLDELRKSFEHIRAAVLNASDADLDKQIKMFGHDTTVRAAFLTALTHLHEHLGQSVAYARINGIVPPWSARE